MKELKAAYQQYRNHRAKVKKRCAVAILSWFVALPIAAVLGYWIYWGLDVCSLGGVLSWLGAFLVVLIAGAMLLWIPAALSTAKGRIRSLDANMSLTLMDQALRESFGSYSVETVNYPILADETVEYNKRFAWLEGDSPFLLHRARITNGCTGEDRMVYFDGIAISIPAAADTDSAMDRQESEAMEKIWGPDFREQIWDNTKFGLDEIDNKWWMTVGFFGLTLGEKDVPWDDFYQWHQQCRQDVALLQRAVELVYATFGKKNGA